MRLLLQPMPGDFEVLKAADCGSAFELIKLTPDLSLVLLDLGLPDIPGLEAINRGAMGFIPKSSDSALLFSALPLVLTKGVYIPASVFTNSLNAGEATPLAALVNKSTALHELGLSDRQIEVLSLLVQGLPNKLIARSMSLSEATVKSHVAATFRALCMGNRTQAVLAVGTLGYRFR